MVVLEIAFVLVNLAVPYWLWTNKSTAKVPEYDRVALQRGIFRVVSASGVFEACSTQDLSREVLDLCDLSREQFVEAAPVPVGVVGNDVAFACQVHATGVNVRWAPNLALNQRVPAQASEASVTPSPATVPARVDCGPSRDEQVALAPSFQFNFKGQLRTITYAEENGARGKLPLQSCRQKLAAAKRINPVPDEERLFFARIGTPNGSSEARANHVCLLFDPAEDWEPFRQRYVFTKPKDR